MKSVFGILLDLDGVFYVGDQLLAGSLETLEFLDSNSIPYCFITNTTTKSARQLQKHLQTLGLPADPEKLLTAPKATCEYLHQQNLSRCWLVVSPNTLEDFTGIENTPKNPEAVVIGDIGDVWDYPLLNGIFQAVINGAKLIAMHKNKYWQTEEGLQVDIGAFVAGLEYVTDTQAVVTGKPAEPFFSAALTAVGCSAEQAILVGDDINSDVGAAQQAGIRGILVRTGKYREELAASSDVTPDAIIDSIADLSELIRG